MDGGSQKRVDADMGNTTVYRASTAGIKRRELNPYTERGACMFHRVREIKPIREYELQVTFIDGTIKIYDVTPLFDEIEAFNTLKAVPGLFEQVKVDAGGYGISWNDEIDLACDELWKNGTDNTALCG